MHLIGNAVSKFLIFKFLAPLSTAQDYSILHVLMLQVLKSIANIIIKTVYLKTENSGYKHELYSPRDRVQILDLLLISF